MSYNPHKAPKRVLLCAVRFLAGTISEPVAGGGGFRRFTRQIARAQGLAPTELDKAERELIRAGYITKSGGMHPTLDLTERGVDVSRSQCRNVSLAPWDWRVSYPRSGRHSVSVAGAKRRRR